MIQNCNEGRCSVAISTDEGAHSPTPQKAKHNIFAELHTVHLIIHTKTKMKNHLTYIYNILILNLEY